MICLVKQGGCWIRSVIAGVVSMKDAVRWLVKDA